MTADHTPERLSAEDREALLVPCVCGHTLNDHGDLAGCWLCPEENRECDVTCEALIVAGVERILAAHLADVEARLAAVETLLDHAKAAQEASPARLFGGGLFPALISADMLDRALHPRPERTRDE